MDFEKLLSEKLDEKKYELCEDLFNECSGTYTHICLSRDDGSIYSFFECGGTVVDDIVLYTVDGNYQEEHSCDGCPLNCHYVDDLSEKIGQDAEEMTPENLTKFDVEFREHYWTDDEKTMTVEELRNQCVIDQIADLFESYKAEMLQRLNDFDDEELEKVFGCEVE